MKNKEASYIGPNKLFGLTTEKSKTPSGKDIVRVVYEGENLLPEIMPLATFERLVTKEPKDYNWLRETRYSKLLEDLTLLCMETDVRYSDIKYLGTELAKKMDAAFERATNFLWTGDDKQWIPGFVSVSDRTLLEADIVLKKIKSNGAEQTKSE